MGNKLTVWLGIIGGIFVVLGGVGWVTTLYIHSVVDSKMEDARPPSVVVIEQDIAVIKNDLSHMRNDITAQTAMNQETLRIFREYLQSQQR